VGVGPDRSRAVPGTGRGGPNVPVPADHRRRTAGPPPGPPRPRGGEARSRRPGRPGHSSARRGA